MSKVGFFNSGYGLLRVPIGAVLTDAGILDTSSAIQPLDGSTFNGSTNARLLAAWKEAGFPGAKDATFNASSAPIVTMTGASSPAGYAATASNTVAGSYEPWRAFNNDGDTGFWYTDPGYTNNQWLQLDHPAVMPFMFKLKSKTGNEVYSPLCYATQYWNGSSWVQDSISYGVSWSSGSYNTFYPTSYNSREKTRLAFYGSSVSQLMVPEFSIHAADFATIFSTSNDFITAQPVRVATLGTLPTGLTADTTYYVREGVDDNNFTLYDTAEHATAGGATGLIHITDPGSGTFKVYPYPVITLSTTTNDKLYY